MLQRLGENLALQEQNTKRLEGRERQLSEQLSSCQAELKAAEAAKTTLELESARARGELSASCRPSNHPTSDLLPMTRGGRRA